MSYSLKELIADLRTVPPETVVPFGFAGGHSYRGYYEDLEFRPATNVTVGSMLAAAEGMIGKTIRGYKGGDYKVGEYTTVWIGEYGECHGQTLGPYLIRLMLGLPVQPPEGGTER